MISLAAAITLTNWSKRTLWRRIADGTLTRADDDVIADENKTKIHLDAIKSHICVPLELEDFDLIKNADRGDAKAQTDLALIFLSNQKPENAIYWLELAAKRDEANAMYLLGRCYIDGTGISKNEDIGIMWIAKAASHGHLISQGQMQALRSGFSRKH